MPLYSTRGRVYYVHVHVRYGAIELPAMRERIFAELGARLVSRRRAGAASGLTAR